MLKQIYFINNQNKQDVVEYNTELVVVYPDKQKSTLGPRKYSKLGEEFIRLSSLAWGTDWITVYRKNKQYIKNNYLSRYGDV
jgi:hypothetical protein